MAPLPTLPSKPESRPDRRDPRPNALRLLGIPPSLSQLLRFFILRPLARPHLRLLQRKLKLGSASVQRDLTRMTAAGVLRSDRERSGRTVRYTPIPHPFWNAVRTLVALSDSTVDLLRDALRDVEGLDAAFLFGSTAAGTAAPDSDLDVLVVADAIDTRTLYHTLFELGQLLGRQVNTVRYTRALLAERLASGAEFPRNVLAGPLVWLAGNPAGIAPIAAAAGVRLPRGVMEADTA